MLCATLRQWSAQHSLGAYNGHEAGQEGSLTSEVKHVLNSSTSKPYFQARCVCHKGIKGKPQDICVT